MGLPPLEPGLVIRDAGDGVGARVGASVGLLWSKFVTTGGRFAVGSAVSTLLMGL